MGYKLNPSDEGQIKAGVALLLSLICLCIRCYCCYYRCNSNDYYETLCKFQEFSHLSYKHLEFALNQFSSTQINYCVICRFSMI